MDREGSRVNLMGRFEAIFIEIHAWTFKA